MSPTERIAIRASCSCSLGPTPGMTRTDSGQSTCSISAGPIATSPSGFSRSDATLARKRQGATPALAVSRSAARISAFSWRAIATPSARSRATPVRSPYASSIETCSITGAVRATSAKIRSETSW